MDSNSHVSDDQLSPQSERRGSVISITLPILGNRSPSANASEMRYASLSENSKRMLGILSILNPDGVPYELFRHGASTAVRRGLLDLKYLQNPVRFYASLQDLMQKSIVGLEFSSLTIYITKDLQRRSYSQLCKDDTLRRAVFEQAVHLLTCSQPEPEKANEHTSSKQNWEWSKRYESSIKALVQHFLGCPSACEGYENQLASLVYQCAVYQVERSFHSAASETLKLANDILDLSRSPNIVFMSDCRRLEARIFNETNHPAEAIKASQESLAYAEMAKEQDLLPAVDERFPRILTGYANSLSQLKDFDVATKVQQEALDHVQKFPGYSEIRKLVHANWGSLLYCQDKYDDAARVLCQSLDSDPDQPMALHHLGNTYLALGKTNEALAAHGKALDLNTERFGPQHAVSAVSMFKVGQVLVESMKEPMRAISYLRQSLDCFLMQDSPYFNRIGAARAAHMLSRAFQEMEVYMEASEYLQFARDLRSEVIGEVGSTADTDEYYKSLMFYWDQ
ncbi:tetratricopeptide repeat protein [Aspergillus melleus]|uniref:tetratricopeptide repeat protein n=1 Tax=Aspergillus melleus TaxID=138277 RepID=UPI001E8D2B56|nr:uncharacterized protein LDX57_012959 [Aspergillus melleus]KAH8435330.1 hypothetical protein LDX57_012959 [Aspergillus melleus]